MIPADDLRRGGSGAAGGSRAAWNERLERSPRGEIYAEIVGYGMSCDAHHITSPPPDGSGALRCMRAALADARLSMYDVGYISAHATSTPLGDEIELRAITTLVGEQQQQQWPGSGPLAARNAPLQPGVPRSSGPADPVVVSSTKGATGHLLGAAGAVEAAFTVLALRDGVAPPGVNLDEPIRAEEHAELIELAAVPRPLREGCAAMSNSFGFGGTNACLVFRPYRA